MGPTNTIHDIEGQSTSRAGEPDDDEYSEVHHDGIESMDIASKFKITSDFSGLAPPPSKPPLNSSNSASSSPAGGQGKQPSDTPFPRLKASQSRQSNTAAEAAEILANFSTHPSHPRNWSRRRKWKTTLTVAVTGFIATTGSSIGVPGVHAIIDDFGISNQKLGVLVTSTYVLGFGAGPFIFSPISELYGRQVSYLSSQSLFVLFCIGCALAPNMTSLLIMRFLCGVFGSSGPALGVASCADVWKPEERGRPISVYACGPMAGPVMGSMLGYWILYGGWRWLFWTITIMSALNLLLFIFAANETNAEVIEKKLKYRISHPISPPPTFLSRFSPSRIYHDLGWMSAMVSKQEASMVFKRTFSRPFRLLFFNPVCSIFSIYYSYIYACIYMFLVSTPLLFGSPPFEKPGLFSYEFPQSTLSLSYLGLTIGFAMAATIAATFQDKIYLYLKRKNGGRGAPEYRLVMTQTGMIIMPIGLFIYGWTANAEVHWIAPQIGSVFVALGLMLAFNSIQNFLVDAFFPYSAAAIAAATASRSVTSCLLPLFIADMYESLGWGKGCTLLAGIALIAVPAPLMMFKYGRQLRERYAFEG